MFSNPYALLQNIRINKDLTEKIKFENLKPVAEVDKYTWLSNSHLDQIQDHFKKYFKNYYYSYIHMSDLVMVDHNYIKHVKDEIFNTDTSDKGGQHWFSIFMNLDTNSAGSLTNPLTIEYFNSAGTKIMSNLKEFFTKLALQISKELNKTCIFVQVTNIQHQSSDTGTCGCYALFYLYSRLNGVPYQEFNNKQFIINDDIIVQIRQMFFNDPKKITQ